MYCQLFVYLFNINKQLLNKKSAVCLQISCFFTNQLFVYILKCAEMSHGGISRLCLPEPSGWVQSPSKGSSSRLGSQVGRQGRYGFGIVTRVICKLDSYRFSGALWDRSVQFLNGAFGFNSLIKTDEPNTFGEPLKTTKKNKNEIIKRNQKIRKKATTPHMEEINDTFW